jgi:hypothetical protein
MFMTSDRWEILESRVTKLEKQNRRLKVACVLASLAVGTALSLGAISATQDWPTFSKVEKTVEAQRFVLKDMKGETRAELALLDAGEGKGSPLLIMKSVQGTLTSELDPQGIAVWGDGRYDFASPHSPSAFFGLPDGLYFQDRKGRMVLSVGGASPSNFSPALKPEILLFDEKERPFWHAP